jgi:hypothetical protein
MFTVTVWLFFFNKESFYLLYDVLVGIATGYGWDGRALIPIRGKIFLFQNIQTGSGAHPASCTMGTGGLSLGIKQHGCEANHSLSSAKVKNGGAIPPLSHVFMV